MINTQCAGVTARIVKFDFTNNPRDQLSKQRPCVKCKYLQDNVFCRRWQGWQGSNLRPPVLETGALPIELHSYRGPCVAADPRRFKHRPCPDCKGEAVPETPCSSPAFCAKIRRQARRTTRANGRDHDRANRRQAHHRPADPAPAPGQAGIARAVVRSGCSGCRTPSSARSTREPCRARP